MFRTAAVAALLVFVVAHLAAPPVAAHLPDADWNAKRVEMGDGEVVGMYQKWVDTGLSSIMAAIANKRLKKHRTAIADKFGKCSGDADTVPKQAKCLSKLLKNQIVDETTRIERYRKHFSRRMQQYGQRARDTAGWTGAFRTKHARRKREIDAQRPRAAATYDLHSAQGRMTPLGGVAKLILESVLAKKNKTEAPKWQTTVQRLRAIGDKKKQLRKEVEESSHESMDQMALRGMRRALKQEDGVDVEELANDPKKMEEFIRDFRHKPNKKPVEKVMDLLRDGMKLGYTLAGQNTTDFDKKTLKVVSPRFFGLVPEEKKDDDEIDLLSPSLFSLHNEGKGTENLTSLHNLVRGMPMRDQQVWLDLVMEAAGVNDQSEKLEKELVIEEDKKKNQASLTTLPIMEPGGMLDDTGVPLYFTKENATHIGGSFEERKIQTFETLQRMYTPEQLHEMNSTGLAYLTPEQVYHLYGPHSPYNNTEMLEKSRRLNHSRMHDYVEEDIHAISEAQKWNIRQKDIVLSPITFTWLALVPALASQPLVLSPVIFSPLILSPSVYGFVILSPWAFVPLVLAPRVIGSLILSPFIFSPIILTPLALHPAILSPGVFNPLILSPSVLTPLILSPQVFTPIILSPLCLDPILLNPLLGSPLILSPFVLSPIIGSPQTLGGLILSPYALSPVLLSPLTAFAAILSPSWLS